METGRATIKTVPSKIQVDTKNLLYVQKIIKNLWFVLILRLNGVFHINYFRVLRPTNVWRTVCVHMYMIVSDLGKKTVVMAYMRESNVSTFLMNKHINWIIELYIFSVNIWQMEITLKVQQHTISNGYEHDFIATEIP